MGTKVKIVQCFSIQSIGYCVIVVLNLFVFVLANTNSKCATLYNSYSYQGSPLSLTDGYKQENIRHMNYVPQSVRITPGCFLTIFDIYGSRKTVDRDSNNVGWSSYSVLDAACCECGGCNGAANKLDGMCARLFENPRCDSCSGYRLDLKVGDQARNFGPLNNKMSSFAVKQGCTLTAFSEKDFGGWRINYTQPNNKMDVLWDKQISSARCGCGSDPIIYPTFPTTRVPITLPTVPTRAPITLPTVPTRAPITLPTVPTTRAPITLPTVPTTRAPITLPTVPTTRAPITLPTVPTTRAPITLPTVPTTRAPITLPTVPTTRAPITLPTVPTTKAPISDEEYSEEDSEEVEPEPDYNWYGGDKSNELQASPSVTTKPTTTTTTTEDAPVLGGGWGFEDEENEKEDVGEPDASDESEEEDWDSW